MGHGGETGERQLGANHLSGIIGQIRKSWNRRAPSGRFCRFRARMAVRADLVLAFLIFVFYFHRN